jgi:uncharacterized membrane protein
MTTIDETRLAAVERRTESLAARLERLEASAAASVTAPAPPPRREPVPVRAPAPQPASPAVQPAPPARPRPSGPSLEDLVGGRLLAWMGGLAIVVAIAFLFAIAVSHGWIGEGVRTILAGLGSLGLLSLGAWMHERRGRTDAALAATAAGIAGMFLTVVVGGPVYGVLPPIVALVLALVVGGVATALAVRWEAQGIGGLGIVGALLAPVLAGAPSSATTLALLWIAGAAGAGVLVWQRWGWLAVAVFGLTLPQWADVVVFQGAPLAGTLLALSAFGALNVAVAIGFELRVPSARLRGGSAFLLTANAIALAALGSFALGDLGQERLADTWLATLAIGHAAVGLGVASTRVNRDIRLLMLALAVVLADVTLGSVLDGPALAGAWALATAGLGWLARQVVRRPGSGGRDEALLGLGLGGHVLLTATQALVQAPPGALADGDALSLGAHTAVAMATAAAFVAGRFADEVRREWRIALDAVALAGTAYLTAMALDGAVLAAALAAQAAVLASLAIRGEDRVAAWGAVSFLGASLLHALAFEAPPAALVAGLDDVAGAFLALGVAGAVAVRGAYLARAHERICVALAGAGGVTLLYLASTALITVFASGPGGATVDLLELGPRQLGQAVLSGMWGVVGVVALLVGLRRDVQPLRAAALTLLLVAVAKVFLFDLAALTSVYRVASFLALGLLLLTAAFVWQRLRPRPLPDLRAAPPALR